MREVIRVSPLTGNTNTMYMDISDEQLQEWNDPNRTRLIQDIFPNLTEVEREFIMTGYTVADWKEMEKAFNDQTTIGVVQYNRSYIALICEQCVYHENM